MLYSQPRLRERNNRLPKSPMINLADLQKLTAEISARLVRSSSESLDDDIMLSLAEALPALKADRGGLLSVNNGSPIAQIAYAWYAEGVTKVPRYMNLIDHFPWGYQTLVIQQRVMSIASLDDYPPEADIDRRTHEGIGTKSILSVPLMIGSRVHHVLTLHSLEKERRWSAEIVDQVRLIGEIFVSALQRREAELILKDANDRLELAARSAGCGMWEINLDTGEIWATNKSLDHFGFAPDQPVSLRDVMDRIDPADHALVLSKIEEARRTEQEVTVKYRLACISAGQRWLVSRGRMAAAGPERGKLLVGVTLDITESMEMEQRLQDKVREIEELRRQLERENEYLRKEAGAIIEQGEVLGSSAKMREVMT